MNLPPYVRVKHGSAYHVRRRSGKMVWQRLCRVADGEAAVWSAYESVADRPETIADLLAAFSRAEDGLLKLKPKTQLEYSGAISRHLIPEFGRTKPNDLTQMRVAMFLDSIGNVAANRAVATLSSALSWGMRKGYCSFNAARGVRRNTERPRTRYVTHEELQNALDNANPAFERFMLACYLTGLRQGDLRELRRNQVTDDGLLIEEKKRGKRIVVEWGSGELFSLVTDACDNSKCDHVFTNEAGEPLTVWGIQSAMRRLDLDWNLHDLRAKAESDHDTGLGLLSRYKRARRVRPVDR